MPVAFDAVAHVAPATGGSFSVSITCPSGNPVILVGIGLDSATATVSAVTWSLGSGTAVEIKTARLNTSFASICAIPAPSAGHSKRLTNLFDPALGPRHFTECLAKPTELGIELLKTKASLPWVHWEPRSVIGHSLLYELKMIGYNLSFVKSMTCYSLS